jgi:hypothetical protein
MTKWTKQCARLLLEELESGWLEVIKVPGRDGGYVRVPTSVNAEWYQRFCRLYEQGRRRYPKPRTIIKRCHTIRALGRLVEGGSDGVYAERLAPFLEDKIRELPR